MIKEKLRSLSGLRWTGPLLFGLGLFCVLLLTAQIALYCDDYWYGTFLTQGWDHFWELTIWHYINFNGRAFIHFMCQLALVFDYKLFVVLNPLMLGFIFVLGQRLQGRETPWQFTLLTAGVACLAVVALPLLYVRTAVLWISAAFNYIFPLCIMLPVFWLYQKNFQSRRAWIGVLAACFLAGATTEQTGFAACVCIGGWGLLGLLRKTLSLKRAILPVLFSGAGYATIIFAPGTWLRVDREIGGGVLKVFQPEEFLYRFRLSMSYMTGIKGVPALFIAFCLLFALHTALKRKKLLWALPGLGALAVYLLLIFTHHYFFMELFSVLAFLGAAGYYLWKPETTARGLLLLGMLGAQLIMLLNRSAAHRTALPAILLLLAVCASMLAECFACLPRFRWTAPAASALLMLCLLPGYLPTLQGYMANTPANRANEKELWDRSDDVISIDLNLDKDYMYLAFFSSDNYLVNAMDYYGITDERMEFTCEGMDLYGLYGERTGLPALKQEGELYLPLQSAARVCGGDGYWTGIHSGIALNLQDKHYFFRNSGDVFFWDEENKQPLEKVDHVDICVPFYTHYIPAETFCRLFGAELEYNEDQRTYYIRLEE